MRNNIRRERFVSYRKEEPMSKKTQSAASPQTLSEQIHADHLIIVTNRGPVEYSMGQDNTLQCRRGEGGVVTALIEAMPSMETTWIALAMTEADRMAVQQAHDGLLPFPLPGQRTQLRYVTVPKSVYHNHYDIVTEYSTWLKSQWVLALPALSTLVRKGASCSVHQTYGPIASNGSGHDRV
jgi:hypothetical protein